MILIVDAQLAFAMRSNPLSPQAGHAEDARISHGEPEWLFAGWRGLPFVKAAGGNQAALFLEWFSEAGFPVDGFGGGVNQFVADGFTLRSGDSKKSLRSTSMMRGIVKSNIYRSRKAAASSSNDENHPG